MSRRARVRLHADDHEDLAAQLDWLEEHEQPDWIEMLKEDLHHALETLAEFPEIGVVLDRRAASAREPAATLRKLILRRTPFVLWYAVTDERDAELWVLRMFHAHQDRPHPSRPGRRKKRRKS